MEQMSGAPRMEQMSGAPRMEQMSGAPRMEQMSGAPRMEQMSGAPRQQQPPPPQQQPVKSNNQQVPPAVLSFLAGHPLNMELISRPEGKQLLTGLESGNITIDHLVQQLKNPALQVRLENFCLATFLLFLPFLIHSKFLT